MQVDDAPVPDRRRGARRRRVATRRGRYRDARWGAVFAGVDPDPANVDAIRDWSVDYYEALHPYSAGGAYVNMMMDEGQERVRASYRDNYDRLAGIKATYDPDNMFRVNQNIQPAGDLPSRPRGASAEAPRRAVAASQQPRRRLPVLRSNEMPAAQRPVYASAPSGGATRIASAAAARARAFRRHDWFRALIRPDAEMRIVDLGCGHLGLREWEPSLDVTGVDIAPRPHYPGPFVCADATQRLPFADGEFDLAFSNSLIEHLPRAARAAFAAEVRRIARGWWVQTPAYSFPIEPHSLLLAAHWSPAAGPPRLLAPGDRRRLGADRAPAPPRDARAVRLPDRRRTVRADRQELDRRPAAAAPVASAECGCC